jgi:hypothetical protein
VGGYIKVISITKYSLWISFSVGYPHFIERGGQFFEVETVHEFNARTFKKLVQRQDFEIFKQRCRMGSEGGISDDAYGLFLLFSKFFQICGICGNTSKLKKILQLQGSQQQVEMLSAVKTLLAAAETNNSKSPASLGTQASAAHLL